MRTITRHSDSDAAQNFSEVTTGDAPCSIEMSMNAKGLWQPTVKLYYPDAATLEECGPDQLARVLHTLCDRFPTPAGTLAPMKPAGE